MKPGSPEELDKADMVRVYTILNGNDKVDIQLFWRPKKEQEEGN